MPYASHDPFLYAYFRACGGQRDDFYAYLRQLGIFTRAPRSRRTPPVVKSVLAAGYPSWATPKIRVLAATAYADKPPTVRQALNAIDAAIGRLESNPPNTSGPKRALVHAQAKLLAAITDHTGRYRDPLTPERVSTLFRFMNPKTDAKARYIAKIRRKKSLLASAEWQRANDEFMLAFADCRQAKAQLRVAKMKLDEVRMLRRQTIGFGARVPRAALAEFNAVKHRYLMLKTKQQQLRFFRDRIRIA